MKQNDRKFTTEAADTNIDLGRREALQKIAVGVGVVAGASILPESWTRPIIGQIVLPAHAATSGSSLHDPCAVELRSGDSKSATVVIKVTGFVTPPTANLPVTITATAVGGAGLKVEGKSTTDANGNFEAFLTIGGGPGITSVNVTTVVAGADGAANCVVHTTSTASSSSTCSVNDILGAWSARGTNLTEYPVVYFTIASGGPSSGPTTGVTDGDSNPRPNGTWSLSGNVLTLIFPWEPADGNGTDTYVLTLTTCKAGSGTVYMSGTDTEGNPMSGSMGAVAPATLT